MTPSPAIHSTRTSCFFRGLVFRAKALDVSRVILFKLSNRAFSIRPNTLNPKPGIAVRLSTVLPRLPTAAHLISTSPNHRFFFSRCFAPRFLNPQTHPQTLFCSRDGLPRFPSRGFTASTSTVDLVQHEVVKFGRYWLPESCITCVFNPEPPIYNLRTTHP